MNRLAVVFAVLVLIAALPAQATEAGWALLRNGGQIVLLAHADAPGTGDPARFDIENCRTQRNLSDRGRQQARRIGALFAARAAPIDEVFTSRYCRAADTARLAFSGETIEELEALDSFAREPEKVEVRTQEIVELAADYTGSENLILVTHPENIETLVGARPRMGEAVIVVPAEGGLQQIGRIIFN